ncbi:MAG TPA: hypothetical protein VLJ61_06570 [Pyrinomonadaceae bacterium]|nr:hypothetical protein [Pyrinomonadaceae bacterium]
MKPRTIIPRLAPLVAAVMLLNFAHVGAAQRRRTARRAQTTSRPAATPTPQAQTQPRGQTQTTPAQATPTPTPQTPTAGAQTLTTNAGAQTLTQGRGVPDSSVEDLLSADGFGIYVEVRRVGTLTRAEELKTAVGALKLFGAETEPLTDLFSFVNDNSEKLSEARAVLAFMPTRAGLPEAFIALELPSDDEAAAFEPKFRGFVGDKVQTFTDEIMGPRRAQKSSSEKQPTGAKAENSQQGASGFTFRRVGRLLLTANEPFTLRKLRGEEGANSLAESVRFQSARTRFASDSLFVYVDTTLAQQGYEFEQQKSREQREALAAAARAGNEPATNRTSKAKPNTSHAPVVQTTQTTRAPSTDESDTSERVSVTVKPVETQTAQTTAQTSATPAPSSATPQANTAAQASPSSAGDTTASQPQAPTITEAPVVVSGNTEQTPEEDGAKSIAATATKPSEEQVTVWRMGGLLSNIVRGAPRIPGSVALGLRLEGGAFALRVAVENTPDGVVSVIPFLPNVVAGPPVTAAASEVAPDDSDIFITTSLDWDRIYTSTLGTASLDPSLTRSWLEDGEGGIVNAAGAGEGKRPPTPDETVAAVEKIFGFKIKEDLLPALGNEVAISLPFSYLNGPRLFGSARNKQEKDEEKDAEPGLVFIVTLNDPEKIQEILPRALAAFQLVSLGTPFAAPEKREGFEIHTAGEFAYVVINNFLVASDLKAVRHVVDSYAARRTLASSDAYRNAVSWQAQQKVLQVFVSDALMKSEIEDTKKRSGESTDPAVRVLLAQLDMTPEPASYEATNEGDALVHEVRVPAGLLKAYAVSEMIMMKDMAVITGEMEAAYTLRRVHFSEQEFKNDRKKERFGTLEELLDEKILEKDYVARLGYKIELSAAGDKFTATATPKTYGKTGRRSFFIDETGEIRAADHKGQPATADDPPVD